jgi:hypothetical protein
MLLLSFQVTPRAHDYNRFGVFNLLTGIFAYIGSRDGTIVKVNAATGLQVWSVQAVRRRAALQCQCELQRRFANAALH